jgi:hypothetical protein
MVKVTEKRTEKIEPTKIDMSLLVNVGQVISEECPKDHKVSIVIVSNSRDIETDDYRELKNMEIPADTRFIRMSADEGDEEFRIPWTKPIEVAMDVDFPRKNSRVSVRGNNATWVQGVSERLVKEFDKKKLMHRYIAKYEFSRVAASMAVTALLVTVLGFALLRFAVNPSLVSLIAIGLWYAVTMLLKRFFDWLFPYFDIDNPDFRPRKFRKAAVGLLLGSGIVGILIEWGLRLILVPSG